ncbi:MAG: AIR synthase-related protein, partial [Acidobacteriota bacterium]|nr:AIR synthase-related protein [Acidobacteriota bacterium]
LLHGVEAGRPPAVDLEAEAALCALLRQSRRAGWLSGCHDLADGGLLLALAECAMVRGIGLRAAVDCGPLALFSEGQARAIVTVPAGRTEDLLAAAEAGGVAAREIGDVGGDRLVLDFDGGAVDGAVDELRRVWREALPRAVG